MSRFKRIGGWMAMGGLTVLLTWLLLAGLTKTMKHTTVDAGIQDDQPIAVKTELAPEIYREHQSSAKNQIKPRTSGEGSPTHDTSPQAEALPSPDITAIRTAYQRTGATVLAQELPPIRGEASSPEEYLTFARAAGFRFVLFNEDRTNLAEIVFDGDQPAMTLKPEIDFRRYAKQGRLIDHPELVRIAHELATVHGIAAGSLYALLPLDFDRYLRGKLISLLHDEHVSPDTVRFVQVKFCIKGAVPGHTLPTMEVLRIVHQQGEIIPHDPEM